MNVEVGVFFEGALLLCEVRGCVTENYYYYYYVIEAISTKIYVLFFNLSRII